MAKVIFFLLLNKKSEKKEVLLRLSECSKNSFLMPSVSKILNRY